MAYEVLARKWRPQTFEDVVGQDHVTRTLRNAIESKRLAHAYLFVGPRGIGKTSIARIFARALNCEKGPTVEPCGTCDACREIAAGISLDVLEIDGASNNGVEQVRELRETVKFAPAHGQFKIYIIDEVHMLSVPAFNALLKTLEEPPAHVKFIFATTEPQKILATILSRCQRFDLRRIPTPLIVERLRLIAKSEKVKVDDDAFLAIARGAEGGLRDAESALDQLISFRGREIAEADVLSVFGLVSRGILEELADAILKGDIRLVVGHVSKLDEAGKDLPRLVTELMEHFRNLLVCLSVKDVSGLVDLTETQIGTIKRQAAATNAERVLRLLTILSDAEDRMKYSLSKRTLLETALIRCARASVVVSLEEILLQIRSLVAEGGAAVSPEGARSPAPAAMPPPQRPPAPAGAAAVAEPSSAYGRGAAAPPSSPENDLRILKERWREIVERVGKVALLAKSALVDARPVSVRGETVVIGVDKEFSEEKQGLEAPRIRKVVEHVVGGVLNRAVTVHFKLAAMGGSEEEAAADAGGARDEPRPAAVPSAAPRTAGAPAPKPQKGRSKREWADDPAVRKALETFEGSIVDVRE